MTTLSGPDWKRVVPPDPEVPAYSVFTKPIEKSPRDEREYRIIQLDNGLKATLVHDIETDKAAASLDVAVGHLFDPVRFFYCAVLSRSSVLH
jgi:insulysin